MVFVACPVFPLGVLFLDVTLGDTLAQTVQATEHEGQGLLGGVP